jgi:hypothetical protein
MLRFQGSPVDFDEMVGRLGPLGKDDVADSLPIRHLPEIEIIGVQEKVGERKELRDELAEIHRR